MRFDHYHAYYFNCFGLDFAYRLTREHHPDVDFRFIPNLEEIQTLLTPQTTATIGLKSC